MGIGEWMPHRVKKEVPKAWSDEEQHIVPQSHRYYNNNLITQSCLGLIVLLVA